MINKKIPGLLLLIVIVMVVSVIISKTLNSNLPVYIGFVIVIFVSFHMQNLE